jgi:uncharacterized protein YndB with AHSA1/START domain
MQFEQYTISVAIATDPTRLWAAITEPDWMSRWMWGDMAGVQSTADLRPGGFWRSSIPAMRPGTGRERDSQRGMYVVVEAPRRLVFTLNWDEADVGYNKPGANVLDELIIFDISAGDGGTGSVLTLTHLGIPDRESAELHRQSVEPTLHRLRELLESEG